MPFPWRKASTWEAGIAGDGGGSMTAFEKGYAAVLLDKCLMNVLHDFENIVTVAQVIRLMVKFVLGKLWPANAEPVSRKVIIDDCIVEQAEYV
jgi:hypothetical protein